MVTALRPLSVLAARLSSWRARASSESFCTSPIFPFRTRQGNRRIWFTSPARREREGRLGRAAAEEPAPERWPPSFRITARFTREVVLLDLVRELLLVLLEELGPLLGVAPPTAASHVGSHRGTVHRHPTAATEAANTTPRHHPLG